jgi:hypothetical protein
MRLLWRAVLVLVLVAVVGLAAIHLWLDTLIEDAVEWIGPQVTQTSVSLDGVRVSFVGSQVQLAGLTVGNPPGFKASHAIKVERAAVRLDWRTALADRVVIETIEIERPEIVVEGILSRSNISVIQDNIKAFSSPGGGGMTSAGQSSGRHGGTRKLVIKEITITNGQAVLWLPSGSQENRPTTIALPNIHLKDIGTRSGGVTPQELSLAIVDAMNHEASRVVAKSAGEIGGAAEKVVSDAAKGLKGFLDRNF